MSKARILLADDHALVLEGGKATFSDSYEIVGTVSDGRSLVEAALRLKPDLILLDISMPLLSGVAAAHAIKAAHPTVKLLFLTMHSERPYLQAAFEAGAAGYVLKSDGPEELRRAVESVLTGGLYISPSLSVDMAHIRGANQVARSLRLSSREREVLQLISEGRSGKEIAGILGLSVKTVSFHKENIKRKLGVRTVAELTRNAIAADIL
jgi:DNA-binding NarL/FixJ family response regulator